MNILARFLQRWTWSLCLRKTSTWLMRLDTTLRRRPGSTERSRSSVQPVPSSVSPSVAGYRTTPGRPRAPASATRRSVRCRRPSAWTGGWSVPPVHPWLSSRCSFASFACDRRCRNRRNLLQTPMTGASYYLCVCRGPVNWYTTSWKLTLWRPLLSYGYSYKSSRAGVSEWVRSGVLRPRQHNIGYMGDGSCARSG